MAEADSTLPAMEASSPPPPPPSDSAINNRAMNVSVITPNCTVNNNSANINSEVRSDMQNSDASMDNGARDPPTNTPYIRLPK